MYSEAIQKFFEKIPVQLPKPLSHREKRQLLLNSIGNNCYMKKINEKLPPLKKQKLIKKSQ